MVGYVPESLNEALALKAGMNLVPYGGGTDLMVEGDASKAYLFLHKIGEMKKIQQDEAYIRIGAGCTFAEISKNSLTPPLLRAAVSEIAAPAIRNLGTIGGNVGNGSAKADSALALHALHALVRVACAEGERIIPIREFYLGGKKLDLREDELIVEFLIPKQHIGPFYFEKVGARRALAISRVSFAGSMIRDSDQIVYCAVAFGGINDVVVTRPELDQMFLESTLIQATEIRDLYQKRYEESLAPQKGRISAEYRKKVCMNLLGEFLNQMLEHP